MNLQRKFFKRMMVVAAFIVATIASSWWIVTYAANITWTATSTCCNWSSGSNWSGNSVPTISDDVFFSASSTNNATIDTAAYVKSITISSTYTGVISVGTGSSLVVGGLNGWNQSGGTFQNAPTASVDYYTNWIEVRGGFNLNSGAVFNGRSGWLAVRASSTWAGTFNANSSTVLITSTSSKMIASGTATFYNLYLGDASYVSGIDSFLTVPTGSLFTVNNLLRFDTNSTMVWFTGGGELDAKGDITQYGYENPNDINAIATGTFNLTINGGGTQLIEAKPGTGHLYLPSVTINKSSGIINLSSTVADGAYPHLGDITVTGNWTNNNGSSIINPGNSTVMFIQLGTSTNINSVITGSTTFSSLIFGDHNRGAQFAQTFTISTGTIITVQSSTRFGPEYNLQNFQGGGQINMQAGVYLDGAMSNVHNGVVSTSTFNFVLNGTGTQIFEDVNGNSGATAGADTWYLQSLTVNKSTGYAFVSSTYFYIPTNLTVAQGEFRISSSTTAQRIQIDGLVTISSTGMLSDYASGTSTVIFGGSVINNGGVSFIGGAPCIPGLVPILLNTSSGAQISWAGTGKFVMYHVKATNQAGTSTITVMSGIDGGGNGANWGFVRSPIIVPTQSSTAQSASATALSSTLPFAPKPGDLIVVAVSANTQSISGVGDNRGNAYSLIASSSASTARLSLYYAKNASGSMPFVVNATTAGPANFLTMSVVDFTAASNSSTLDTFLANTDTSGLSSALTSNAMSGSSANELYVGVSAFVASTTLTSGSGWTTRLFSQDNSNFQALNIEDQNATSSQSVAANWTAATNTIYAAMGAIFKAPSTASYPVSGYLDSATFDTRISSGTQLNSVLWQGSLPAGTSVGFQFAVSNSSSGAWSYLGPDGTSGTYFTGSAGTPINLVSNNASKGYTLFNGYRYYRYRVTLFADSSLISTPTVTQVTVNWSP
jgi:hypothetical protein